MSLTLGIWKRVLGSGALCLFLVVAAPAIATPDLEPVSYAEMSDAQLNEALKGWSALDSANRRGLLVEIKRRMERPQQVQARTPGARTQVPAFTVHIRIQQTRQFGVTAAGQPTDVRTSGMLVIRGGFAPVGKEAAAGAQGAGQPSPQVIRLRPLQGPDFGRGFEQRQAFYRAAEAGQSEAEMATTNLSEASVPAEYPDPK